MKINGKNLCEFEIRFQCKKHWDDLDETFLEPMPQPLEKLEARYCHSCQNNVYFARSRDELDVIARANSCAAFDGELEQYLDTKFSQPAITQGYMRPTLGVIAKTREEYEQELENNREKLSLLINLGKDRGYITHEEINQNLPEPIVDPDVINELIQTFLEMGIKVREK